MVHKVEMCLLKAKASRDNSVSHTNRISPKDTSGKAKKVKVRWDQIHMGYDWKNRANTFRYLWKYRNKIEDVGI